MKRINSALNQNFIRFGLFTLLFLGMIEAHLGFAQNRQPMEVLKPFMPSAPNPVLETSLKKTCSKIVLLDANNQVFTKLFLYRPTTLKMALPTPSGDVIISLVQAGVLTNNVSFYEQGKDGTKAFSYKPGLYYQGEMEGDSGSHISISFFENGQIMGVAWSPKPGGNLVIGRLKPSNGNWLKSPIAVYDDANLTIKNPFLCGTPADLPANIGNRQQSRPSNNQTAATCKSITNYWEAGLTLYNQFGNTTSTTNYLTGLFNIVNNLYNAEQLNHQLNRIQINSASDATDLTTQSTALNTFGTRVSSTLTENLGHYFTGNYSSFGGLAWVGVLCYPNNQYKTGTSNLYATNNALPTYSWDAEVTTHEMGHNCGSKHTQWCGWDKGNGIIGQIDSCYASEAATGSTQCYSGTTIARVGTIMSYCHLNGSIDFSLGFGPLPGAKIRSDYNNASCLSGSTPPSVSISGPGNLCSGDNLVLSATAVAGATYSWTGPNSFTASTSSITRTGFTSAMAGNYVVTISVNGCTSTSFPKAVSIGNLVTLVNPVTGVGICEGDNLPIAFTFNCTPTGSTSCQVQISNGTGSWASPVTLGTFTSPTSVSTVLTGTSTLPAGNYRLRIVTTHLGSTSTTNYPLGIGIGPKTGTPANVSATICSGTATTLSAPAITNAQNANTWYDANNNVVGNNQTFTTPNLTATSTYKLVQKDTVNTAFGKTNADNGSQRSILTNVGNWLRVYNTLTITGFTVNAAAAGSGSIVITDSVTGFTVKTANFTLANSGNNVISNLSLQLSPGIYKLTATSTVNLFRGNVLNGQGYPYRINGICEMLGADDGNAGHFNSSFFYWFYNLQLGYGKCASSPATYAVNISTVPTPTIIASGGLSICMGGSVTLTASASGGSSYLWNDGSTDNTRTVSSAGVFTVRSIANGCTSLASTATVVTVNPIPTASISPGGATTFCSGGNVVLTASGGSSYLWNDNSTGNTLTATASGNYSVKAIANGCTSANSVATVVTVNTCANNWTGSTSTDWATPANWSAGSLPNATTDVTIPTAQRNPVISGSVSIKSLTVSAGVNLLVNGTLSLAGNLVNNGAVSGSGTLKLNGSNHTISGTAFDLANFNLAHSGTATLNTPVGISGSVILASGTLNANGNLIIRSNANGTGLIDDFSAGNSGTITGQVIAERYFPGSGWHMVAAPVTGSTLATSSLTCSEIQTWSEALNTTVAVPANCGSTVFDANATVIVKEPGGTKYSLSGSANTGNYTFSLVRSAGSVPQRGFNFVSNPYPSPIAWSAVAATSGLLANSNGTAYIWNPATSNYGSISSTGVTTGSANNLIQSGQGFLLRRSTLSTAGSATMTFKNSHRVNTNNAYFIRKAQIEQVLRLVLKNQSSEDDILLYSSDDASADADHLDAEKLHSHLPVAGISSGNDLAVNALPHDFTGIIPLNISAPETGLYTLSVKELGEVNVTLEDKKTGTFTALSPETKLDLILNENNTNRFFLHYGSGTATMGNIQIFAADKMVTVILPTADNATIEAVNTLGQVVATIRSTQKVTRFALPNEGVYVIRVNTGSLVKSRKVVF